MPIFKGAGVAIVTPMKDNFEVDYERLEENINYQIDNGTDCIVIAGTTGEGSTLTEREHLDVIKAAVDFYKNIVSLLSLVLVQTVPEQLLKCQKKLILMA